MNFEVTKEEADYMLNALATRPYAEVFKLLEKLVGQMKLQTTEVLPNAQQVPGASPHNGGSRSQS
jgi:hypothetical protein